MDLIDWSKRIRKLSWGHRYVLVTVDNCNRQAFTQPLPRKTAEGALEAFRKSFGLMATPCPRKLQWNLGQSYAMLEQTIASKGGVYMNKNMQAVNTLGVVDREIGKLKTIFS